ncbi:type III PLP-dependent enzyme [Breoghania sp. L-A4]|uniref:type III PLP-dependent enzyme n=1 Tax=Breoghania sp. L-A4 TaxID=2304600 RepID=UPI0013C2DCF3|nr:type III PLP-dependent enzyme [Breoghania sp. L-A4]
MMNVTVARPSAATPAPAPQQPAALPSSGAVPASYATLGALIADLAPEDPLFCLSLATATRTARDFSSRFPGITTYALKACPLPELVATFAQAGVSAFDVASLQEMALVRRIDATAPLHYNNPIRSDTETRRAYEDFAVRHFTVDDAVGLERLNRAIPPGDRGDVEVSVRLRVAKNTARIDFTAKFGMPPAPAVEMMRAIVTAGYRPAITFHPGSQCGDPQAFATLIASAAEICATTGTTPHTVNVGGGFPVAYDDARCPPLAAYFSAISLAFNTHFDPARTRLVAEPGRALAAPTMSLLTQIKHIRSDGSVYLNDGLYGGLLELTQIDLHLPTRVWRGSAILTGPTEPRQLYGPTCCPIDRFPSPVPLPAEIVEGDRIEFGLTGAYGLATVTHFNGYGPTQVIGVDEILTRVN